MNNWIDRLERRYSRFAIPYLINGLMVGQLAAGLIVLLINWQFSGFISLSRSAVLHGQIWRLITFLFQPVWLGGALGILNLVFYFWMGRFPHDALHRTGRAGCLDQLLFGGRRLAGRHLPEYDVRLHLDVAGAGRAAVRHHPL